MTTWQKFETQAPELATFGRERFNSGLAHLNDDATLCTELDALAPYSPKERYVWQAAD